MSRTTIHDLLRDARGRINRLGPREALAATERGALLIDTRSEQQRHEGGEVPGAICLHPNVLEWRLDPASDHRHPAAGGLATEVIVMCANGHGSSLTAARLRDLGFERASDLAGGFEAWREAGLPVAPPPPRG